MKLLGKLVMLLLAAGAVIFGLALLRETRPDYIPVYDTDEDELFCSRQVSFCSVSAAGRLTLFLPPPGGSCPCRASSP